MKMAGFSSSKRLFGFDLPGSWRCRIEIESTPPAIATCVCPDAICCAAIAIDCRPDEQNRLIVSPAVVIGSLVNTTARRARLPSCSPTWLAAPTTTSSTSSGATFGLRESNASIRCASMSSERVRLKLPRNAFASPVLTLSTMTTSLIGSPCVLDPGAAAVPHAIPTHPEPPDGKRNRKPRKAAGVRHETLMGRDYIPPNSAAVRHVGYRELLKKYIRFLELHTGDNFIEEIEPA